MQASVLSYRQLRSVSCKLCRLDLLRHYSTEATQASTSANAASRSRSSNSSHSQNTGLHFPSEQLILSHLNSLLSPSLPPLPASLAVRIATHKSAAGKYGNHNARLSFIGRRHMRAFLAMFIYSHSTSSPPSSLASQLYVPETSKRKDGALLLPASYLTIQHIDLPLDLHKLGMRVGASLQLEKVMRWRQSIHLDRDVQEGSSLGVKGNGFWKIRGMATESLMGGLVGYYGSATALKFFNSRILPQLELPPELASAVVRVASKDRDLAAGVVTIQTSPEEEILTEPSSPLREHSRARTPEETRVQLGNEPYVEIGSRLAT